jgi:hypothetical protein
VPQTAYTADSIPIVDAAAAVGCDATPTPTPTPTPTDHVTALAPTTGPAGYSIPITGPACTPHADETATITGSWFEETFPDPPGQPLTSWTLYVDTMEDPPGEHTGTVKCLGVTSAGARVIWSEPIAYTVSGVQQQTPLAATPSRAAGEVTFSDACPDIPGLTPWSMTLFTGFTDVSGGNVESGISVRLPTGGPTVSKPLPSYASPGTVAYAHASCDYSGSTSDAIPYYTFAPTRYVLAP